MADARITVTMRSGHAPIQAAMDRRYGALRAVAVERARQIALWGDQSHHSGHVWLAILTEELGEVAAALNDHLHADGSCTPDLAHLREELIQVAAVAVAWAEAIGVTDGEG